MKKVISLVALFAAPAFANPYLGLEYGMLHTDHDFEPQINGYELNPEPDDGAFGAYLGYKFNKNWGLELGYRQFNMDDSKEHESHDNTYEYEQEWNANIDAKQLTLMPMYFHQFNDKWTMKLGAGVSYTQYDFNSSYHAEQEEHVTDIEVITDREQGPMGSNNQWGGIANIGIEYAIISNLTIGANAKYQIDNYATATTLSLMTAYYF